MKTARDARTSGPAADHPEEMTDMDELTSSPATPRSLHRLRWALLAGGGIIAVAAVSVALAVILHRQPAPHPAAVHVAVPAAALGGAGNGQSQWFHLDAGTYRISLRSDQGGRLQETAIMRHAVSGPSADGSYTAAQAPIVALVNGAGNDVEALPGGDYVLVVAALDAQGWSLTVTRVP